jgi:hypothetical protein
VGQFQDNRTEGDARRESYPERESTGFAEVPNVHLKVTSFTWLAFAIALLAGTTSGGCIEVETPEGTPYHLAPTPSAAPEPAADAGLSGETEPAHDAGADRDAAPEMDAATILEAIANNRYVSSPLFAKVTQTPYPSTATQGAFISEWVSTFAAAAYASIDPDGGSTATVPVGTTIIRAVLSRDGGVQKLTLMTKGPAGYNSDLGDWWFGVTDSDGEPLKNDAGTELGRMASCYGCHVPHKGDDFLFGVPADDHTDAGVVEGSVVPR